MRLFSLDMKHSAISLINQFHFLLPLKTCNQTISQRDASFRKIDFLKTLDIFFCGL